ncbi:HupE/UreJ family protein [Steroidobacter flavus]|uniref:HupE/UreJ family protein n=1 Tax=Steroidobacter flavus TaxID=1842136 RepID=A0ABV8SWH3_9GAMM
MTRFLALCALLLTGMFSNAQAHEVRPAFLEIKQVEAQRYRIVWKQPTMGEVAVRLIPHLSNGWLERLPEDQYAAAGFLVRTWNIGSSDSLAGTTLSIEGLEYTITDVLVQVEWLDGRKAQTLLRAEEPQLAIESSAGREVTMPVFLNQGIRHILAGVDHLLFVLGLILIVRNRWMLLKAVSAFTVAHSITLALAMLAKVTLPGPLVEALIALSILTLGVEIVRSQRGHAGLTSRYPWAVAFVFGLFHGMGFAGGLADLGFAGRDLVAKLALFNVGVEIGQLGFIATVLLVGNALLSRQDLGRRAATMRFAAYVVGIAGAYWTFATSAALLGVA